MREWLRNLEALAVAAAFAEEGEWTMAQGMLDNSDQRVTDREASRARPPRTRIREQSYRM